MSKSSNSHPSSKSNSTTAGHVSSVISSSNASTSSKGTTSHHATVGSNSSSNNYYLRYDDDNDNDEYDNSIDVQFFNNRHYYMTTSMRDTLQNDSFYNRNHHSNTNTNTNSNSSNQHPTTSLLTEEDRQRIQYLALRKFHIPGHTFSQDYIYWFSNNHPFFCFCYADHRHPLGRIERIINLVSSLAFGLAATCCVVLWFYYHEQYQITQNGINLNNNNNENDNYDNDSNDYMKFNHVVFSIPIYIQDRQIHVTTGILTLLMFSGPLHVLFDLGIYFLQACPPCRVNGCCYHYANQNHTILETSNATTTASSSRATNQDKPSSPTFVQQLLLIPCMKLLFRQECWLWVGTYVAFLITTAACSLAIHVTLIRASIAENDGNDSDISYSIETYSFMLYYLLEIFVANFIAFPIVTFIMFSGILGCCGRIPILGGRPYQVKKHISRQQKQQKQQQQKQQHQQSLQQSLQP